MKKVCPAALLIAFLLPHCAVSLSLSYHGFLQGNYSIGTASENPAGGRMKWSSERFQLKLDGSRESLRLFLKADAYLDNIEREGHAELREAYADFAQPAWDLRLGRQIMTWGVGDLIFINDVFSKDYEAFFSGRPMEYLKTGVDAVKVGIYPAAASFEGLAIPSFQPNRFPDVARFRMAESSGDLPLREEEPSVTFRNTELAFRMYRSLAGFDASFYYYYGYHRQPSLMPGNQVITLFYPRLSVYGGSMQGNVGDGILALEAGYYDSRQDRAGDDPFVPNSQWKMLVGYQRQMSEDFTIGFQYYAEYMEDYAVYLERLPTVFPTDPQWRQLWTLRLTRFLKHQTLQLSFFAFWGSTDRDYMLIPEVKYHFTDRLWTAVGANIFGGRESRTPFGRLGKDDNLYTQVRFEF